MRPSTGPATQSSSLPVVTERQGPLRPHVLVVATDPAAPAMTRAADNPFDGAIRITLRSDRADGLSPAMDVYAFDDRRVRCVYDDHAGRAIYLLGRAVHPTKGAGEPMLRWCAQVALDGAPANTTILRDLYGQFVILIDDRRRGEVTFISDVLGIRPWYVGAHAGRLVAGSDVLSILDAGLSSRRINLDAVSCWLKYNHDFSNGSVLADYNAVAPGAVCTYDRSGALLRQVDYGAFEYGSHIVAPEDLREALHAEATRSFGLMVSDLDEINMPLSGGFDSRYLAGSIARRGGATFHLTTIQNGTSEVPLARQVAAALNHPLEILPVQRHVLDLFDDPFAFNAAGFPSGRNLASAVARLYPGMPLLSGFLGDSTMRASMAEDGRAYFLIDDAQLSEDALTRDSHKRYALLTNRLDMLHAHVTDNVNWRSSECIRRAVRDGLKTGRPKMHIDFYFRQRFHFANIFLQHLDVAEAMAPFCSWGMINLRVSCAYACYHQDNYPLIFARHMPELAAIPHSYTMGKKSKPHAPRHARRATRHIRQWSVDLAGSLTNGVLSAVQKTRLLTMLPSGLLAGAERQNEIMFLRKLLAFERRLAQSGIYVNWDQV